MSSAATRKPYQGVVQILRFNQPQYLAAAAVLVVTLVASLFLHPFWRVVLLLAATPALFWTLSSLLVSHYVYDRFPLYDLRWAERTLGRTPASWINVHCGFDETSGLLAGVFPKAAGKVVNIYDPAIMTENSIAAAQGRTGDALPTVAGRYHALGLGQESVDAAFLFFAAHELRSHEQRVKLFSEVKRVLVRGGDLILMEHRRDVWNFLAFGPGFLHFFSHKAWMAALHESGLHLSTDFPMTRFVRVYHLRKPA